MANDNLERGLLVENRDGLSQRNPLRITLLKSRWAVAGAQRFPPASRASRAEFSVGPRSRIFMVLESAAFLRMRERPLLASASQASPFKSCRMSMTFPQKGIFNIRFEI